MPNRLLLLALPLSPAFGGFILVHLSILAVFFMLVFFSSISSQCCSGGQKVRQQPQVLAGTSSQGSTGVPHRCQTQR